MTRERLLCWAILAGSVTTLINFGMAVRYAVTTAREVERLRAELKRCVWVAPERAP